MFKGSDVSWWDYITAIPLESNSSHFGTTIHTDNMWAYSSDGSLWVHIDAVIHVPPKIKTLSITTHPTTKGDVWITVPLSINESAILVSMNKRVV